MLKLNNSELKDKLIDILLNSYEGWIKALNDCVDNGLTYTDALTIQNGHLSDTTLKGGKCPVYLYKNYAVVISCEEVDIDLHIFTKTETDYKYCTTIKYIFTPKEDVANFVHSLENEDEQILFGNYIYCTIRDSGYCMIDLDDARVYKAIKACIKAFKEELAELYIKHLD